MNVRILLSQRASKVILTTCVLQKGFPNHEDLVSQIMSGIPVGFFLAIVALLHIQLIVKREMLQS